MPRKNTRFHICSKHAGWFAGTSRERKAETFVEGGPWMGDGVDEGCADPLGFDVCRLWPGTDFYTAEFADCREAELDWTRARELPSLNGIDEQTWIV